MTMHESLKFLDAARAHIERYTSARGPGCWPTREWVQGNLLRNRAAFPRDDSPGHSFNRQMWIALRRHWMAMGPCQPDCHAQHLSLTAAGLEALKLMNADGCGPLCQQHRATRLHFERKVA